MRHPASLAVLLFVAAPVVAQQAVQPTLPETIDWLRGKLRQSMSYRDEAGGSDGLTTWTFSSEVLTAKDSDGKDLCAIRPQGDSRPESKCWCSMILSTEDSMNSTLQGKRVLWERSKDIFVIPLGSLSPTGISVTELLPDPGEQRKGRVFILKATTYGSRQEISHKSSLIVYDKDLSSEAKVSLFAVRFPDREIAERVAKALAHASTLCGAKAEPF